jgi:DNA (cytosine-5)-methyltransferase 1
VSGNTSTHLFAGGGGDLLGFEEAEFTPVTGVNHNAPAVATLRANFDGVRALRRNIHTLDFRTLPRTRVAVGSPICTESTPAGGNPTPKRQEDLDDAAEDDGQERDEWPLTRLTAWDLVRADEVHDFDIVCGENVPGFLTRWRLANSWLRVWDDLGKNVQIASVNAAHIGGPGNDTAPQVRDRIVFVFSKKGLPLPDLRVRPDCMCTECGPVQGIQKWGKRFDKLGVRKVGSYGQQYVYVCPNRSCGHRVVAPVTRPVSSVIDWSLPGQRIADGKPKRKRFTPYPDSTLALVEAALVRYPQVRHLADPDRSQHLIVHIGRDTLPRLTSTPLSTVACKPHHALIRPAARVEDCTLRMLQPYETAQVQRFPRTYTLTGTVEEQYMQVGNAVPVNVAHWLGKSLLPSLN